MQVEAAITETGGIMLILTEGAIQIRPIFDPGDIDGLCTFLQERKAQALAASNGSHA